MNYVSFLEEQITLQEKEVKTMRKFMYAVLLLCLFITIYAAFSAADKELSKMDMLKFGFSIVTGGLALVPRAELVKRKEKISGLRMIRFKCDDPEMLSGDEKEFINGLVKDLLKDSVKKI